MHGSRSPTRRVWCLAEVRSVLSWAFAAQPGNFCSLSSGGDHVCRARLLALVADTCSCSVEYDIFL